MELKVDVEDSWNNISPSSLSASGLFLSCDRKCTYKPVMVANYTFEILIFFLTESIFWGGQVNKLINVTNLMKGVTAIESNYTSVFKGHK